jgi:hypothetical protein
MPPPDTSPRLRLHHIGIDERNIEAAANGGGIHRLSCSAAPDAPK